MERYLRCKLQWCQKVLKNEKEAEEHLSKHPSADFFSRDVVKWDVKPEDIIKEQKRRCRLCLQFLENDEKEFEHLKTHPMALFFEEVSIPKWD